LRKQKLILDTTICIDLFNGQLLEEVTKLPYDLALPDVIVAELIRPPGEGLLQKGFSVLHLAEEAIEKLVALRNQYPKPSTNDLFALLLARIHSCSLITGDQDLRNAAKAEGVEAHGLLWLLDSLVDSSILSPSRAADFIEKILAAGSWLPKRECETRLRRWKR
jgi:predicted nucleic acid-binding protein